ncbi:hypothetical protein [Alsobacter sp. R-9]
MRRVSRLVLAAWMLVGPAGAFEYKTSVYRRFGEWVVTYTPGQYQTTCLIERRGGRVALGAWGDNTELWVRLRGLQPREGQSGQAKVAFVNKSLGQDIMIQSARWSSPGVTWITIFLPPKAFHVFSLSTHVVITLEGRSETYPAGFDVKVWQAFVECVQVHNARTPTN